jgi:tetratricopeptide (TPR) repeat protein
MFIHYYFNLYILILAFFFGGVSLNLLNYDVKCKFSIKKSLTFALYNLNFIVPFVNCISNNNKILYSDYDKYVEATTSYNQGIKCRNENNIQCATERYIYALSLMPIFPQAHQNLAIIFEEDYSSINRHDKAIKHHLLSIEQSEDSKFKSGALTNLANVYMKVYGDFSSIKETDSRFQAVFKTLNDALKEWPNNIQCMLTMGVLHSQIGNYDQARDFFLKILVINPQDLHALLNLGNYYFHKNIFDKSSYYYSQVVELARSYNNSLDMIRGYNNLGQCFREMGMQTEALNSFHSALKEFNFYNDINQDDFIQVLNFFII